MDIFKINCFKIYECKINTFKFVKSDTVLTDYQEFSCYGFFLISTILKYLSHSTCDLEFTTYYKPKIDVLNISITYFIHDVKYNTLLSISSSQE